MVAACCLILGATVPVALQGVQYADPTPSSVRQALNEGAYAVAQRDARNLLAALERQRGPAAPETADAIDLLVEALVENGEAGAQDTVILAKRAIELKERHAGPDHPSLAVSLDNLGRVYVARGEYAGALPLHERSIRIRSSTSTDVEVASSLEHLGVPLISLERFDEARPVLERAHRLRESRADAEPLAFTRTLELLSLLYRNTGDFRAAQDHLDQALAIRRRLTPDHPNIASLLHLQGDISYLTGDMSAARRAYGDALATGRRLLPPAHPLLSLFSRKLAAAEWTFGNAAEARRLREEAIRIGEQSLAPCHPDLSAAYNDLAVSYYMESEYTRARSLYERALARAEQCVGKMHSLTATFMFNLGTLATTTGDPTEAERLLNGALQIWSRGLGSNHPFVARAQDALGEVAAARGNYVRARSRHETALKIRRTAFGDQHPDVAKTLTNLALVAERTGDTPAALKYIEEAAVIYARAGASEDSTPAALLLVMRAGIEQRQGQAAAARAHLQEALAIREAQFGPDHPGAASIRAQLATVQLSLGNHDAALQESLRAERAGRDLLRFTIRELPERQALAYAAKRPKGLDTAVSVAAASGSGNASLAYDALVQSRGLVLDELATRAGAIGEVDSTSTVAIRAATSARNRYATLMLRALEDPGAVPRTRLDEARVEKEAAERALAERSADARAELQRAQVGLSDVRRALPPQSALVSFVRYERMSSSSDKNTPTVSVPSYAAFVVRADAPEMVVMVPLDTAATVESLVRAWRAEAGGRSIAAGASAMRAEQAYRAAALKLRNVVWDPVAGHMTGTSRLFIVPDGMLNLVNFAALPADDGRYLAEGDAVWHYVSTERDLINAQRPVTSTASLLALGGAAFNVGSRGSSTAATRRSGCSTFGRLRFEDLPGSRSEAFEISQLWSEAAAGPTMLLTGATATEPALKQAFPQRRVIHLATHGFFLGSDCEPAVQGTRAVGGITPAAAKAASTLVDNPLLLSGLALAGANRRTSAALDGNDGILTAEEIAGLDLRGTEWAVLSACDTGIGEIRTGEGVFGLRRAFQIAGVRTVIMSLWSVEDQATRLWMRALYEGRLKRHLSTADAVREASLTVLRDRRARGLSTHPFYWAAFVAAGDWR